MRRHLYDIRFSLLILLALLCGLGVAWGGDAAEMEGQSIRQAAPNPKYHLVDWERVKTFEDLRLILSTFQFSIRDDHEEFEKVRHLLKEEGR